MNGEVKMEMNISDEELQYQVKQLVRELCESEIKKMIKNTAQSMVDKEISKIIHPLVLSELTEGKHDFIGNYHNYKHKGTLDSKLRIMIKKQLDLPVYNYNPEAKKLSQKYTAAHSDSNPSLIEMVVKNEAEKIIFSTVVPEVETLVKKFIQDKEEIAKLVASKSKELLAGTLKS
jgi:hypothetical protein